MTVDDLPAVLLATTDGGHPKADRDLLRGARQLDPVAFQGHLIRSAVSTLVMVSKV